MKTERCWPTEGTELMPGMQRQCIMHRKAFMYSVKQVYHRSEVEKQDNNGPTIPTYTLSTKSQVELVAQDAAATRSTIAKQCVGKLPI